MTRANIGINPRIFIACISFIAIFIVVIGSTTPAWAQNPVPFINQPLVPDAIAPGGAGFTLTVNGAGFVPASVVNWDGSPRATTFVTSSQLTAAILASDIVTASTATVTVVNPGPGGGVSNMLRFSITVAEASASFQPVVTYPSGAGGGYFVAVADINGDGNLDLVVANGGGGAANDGSVAVLLGKGDGTFQSAVSYDAGGAQTISVAVADVNGDGKPDLVVANSVSLTVGVLLGNGDGSFQPAVTFNAGGSPWSVAVGDVSGDGKPDIVLGDASKCYGCSGAGLVAVLLGNGDGSFQPVVTHSSGGSSFETSPTALALADLTGDGKLDVVMTNYCSKACSPSAEGNASVLLGNGNGTFQPAVIYESGGYGLSIGALAVADVNGDGKPDLLITNGNCVNGGACEQGTVAVLLGNGNGSFQPAVLYGSGVDNATSVAVSDVNGDGKPDLVMTNFCSPGGCTDPGSGSVSVLQGSGDGTFQPPAIYSSGGYWGAFYTAVADVNGDGKPDLLALNFAGSSVGALLSEGSSAAVTTTALVSAPNPSTYGQTVIFTATVSSAEGTPSGTVVLLDGFLEIGSGTLSDGSVAIPNVVYLPAGSDLITAHYQGSSTFGASTSSPLNQVVSQTTTTTALQSSANPGRLVQTINYTATVTSQYGGPITGTVTFLDGGAFLGRIPVSNGQAVDVGFYSAPGVHSITAAYSGDSNNVGSVAPTLTEIVGDVPYPTQTSVATSGSPSFVGQPVTFTSTVTSIYGPIPNGGTVKFYDGSAEIGTGTTSGGIATLTTSSLTGKTHTIKATYAGDATFKTSSDTVKQIVEKYATTTTLVSTPNPSQYGQLVTWTATVTTTGPNPPTGTVVFAGSEDGGPKTLIGGIATGTQAWLNAGTHPVTAEYQGDSYNAPSNSSPLNQVINPASTSTALTSSANPSTQGQSVTFTATVTSNTGAHATGTVTFTSTAASGTTTTLGTVALNGIVAVLSTAALSLGSNTITATYNGAADFTGSSGSVIQMVNP